MTRNNDTFEWPDENYCRTPDNYTRLAECMECHPNEVSRLIQQHAPWNGKAVCDDALRERAAVVAWLRKEAVSHRRDGFPIASYTMEERADAIERGEHRREEGA